MPDVLTPTDILYFFQEIKDLYKETDLKFKETDLKFKETDLKFKETDRLIKEQSKETDRLMKEQSKETDKEIKKVTKAIGRLGGRMGDFIEEMVKPAAVRLFQDRGIEVHEVYRGVTVQRDNDQLEIDLLVIDEIEMVAIECKSSLSTDDVDDHLTRLSKLKKLMPKYRDMNIMGAVAAMVLPDNVARYAYRQGLFVLAQSGDTVIIRNDTNFKPGIW